MKVWREKKHNLSFFLKNEVSGKAIS